MMTKPYARLKATLLRRPDVRQEFEALAPEFELARELIAARTRAGLTQIQLAHRMGTTQSAIARLEGGTRLPSFKTLLRYAQATGTRPVLRLIRHRVPQNQTARH
jgi:DNA-binding XRE family transcriptional regulator